MKIIEAMKKVKQNKEKIADLQQKIQSVCANLSHETPLYGTETANKIKEWSQSCLQLSQDNIKLLCRIQKTNLATPVTITIGDNTLTKTIAEWVWRRREYAKVDLSVFLSMTDRGLREGVMQQSTGQSIQVTIVRNYDPVVRDSMVAMFKAEPHEIDSALEVVNATTDLLE